jgi:hypothetical protein
LFGGIGNWVFFWVWAGSHVDSLRRGDNLCVLLCFGGMLGC